MRRGSLDVGLMLHWAACKIAKISGVSVMVCDVPGTGKTVGVDAEVEAVTAVDCAGELKALLLLGISAISIAADMGHAKVGFPASSCIITFKIRYAPQKSILQDAANSPK